MIAVTNVAGDEADVTYAIDVASTMFSADDHSATPGGQLSTSYTQVDHNTIRITFDASIEGESGISFSGNEAGYLNPQSIDF